MAGALKPVMDWHEPTLKKIAKLFIPRIIGMDISQISLIVGTTVGSILAAGSVTIFNLANNLQAAPLGVFALSISAASFPSAFRTLRQRRRQGFYENFGR